MNRINQIQTVPDISDLINFYVDENSFDLIVFMILINLYDCVEINDEILDDKNSRANKGLKLMRYGIIATAIFIIYVILIV